MQVLSEILTRASIGLCLSSELFSIRRIVWTRATLWARKIARRLITHLRLHRFIYCLQFVLLTNWNRFKLTFSIDLDQILPEWTFVYLVLFDYFWPVLLACRGVDNKYIQQNARPHCVCVKCQITLREWAAICTFIVKRSRLRLAANNAKSHAKVQNRGKQRIHFDVTCKLIIVMARAIHVRRLLVCRLALIS